MNHIIYITLLHCMNVSYVVFLSLVVGHLCCSQVLVFMYKTAKNIPVHVIWCTCVDICVVYSAK